MNASAGPTGPQHLPKQDRFREDRFREDRFRDNRFQEKRFRKSRRGHRSPWISAGAIALLLPLASCGFSFKADIQDGNLVLNSGYEISESLLNQAPWSFKGDPASFVETLDRFEIQDGKIRAFGNFVCPDKRIEPGSLDFVLQASTSQLLEAKIATINCPCITPTDPRIITVNQLLADSFKRLAAGNQAMKVTNVKVGDKKIAMDFRIVTPIESPSPAASPSPADRPSELQPNSNDPSETQI